MITLKIFLSCWILVIIVVNYIPEGKRPQIRKFSTTWIFREYMQRFHYREMPRFFFFFFDNNVCPQTSNPVKSIANMCFSKASSSPLNPNLLPSGLPLTKPQHFPLSKICTPYICDLDIKVSWVSWREE